MLLHACVAVLLLLACMCEQCIHWYLFMYLFVLASYHRVCACVLVGVFMCAPTCVFVLFVHVFIRACVAGLNKFLHGKSVLKNVSM